MEQYIPLLVLLMGALRLDGLDSWKGRTSVGGHGSRRVGLGWAVRWQVRGVGHAQTEPARRERPGRRRRRLDGAGTIIAGEGCSVDNSSTAEGAVRARWVGFGEEK